MRLFKWLAPLAILLLLMPSAALAQVTLELNRSDESAIRYLTQRGFSDIQVVDRDILKLRVEGCRQGIRYRFKLRLDGQVYDEAKIGDCGRVITVREAQQIAAEQGLRNAQVRAQGNAFVASGCVGTNRIRLVIALNGEVQARDRDGPCRAALSADELAGLLQERGYDRIDVLTSDTWPAAIDACLEDVKYRLRISEDGEIAERRITGECARAMDVREMEPLLRKRGYDRIAIVDPKPPRFRFEACRNGQRLEVVLDIYGRNIGEERLGECNPPLDRDGLTNVLLRQGFYRITVDPGDGRRFSAKACYASSEMELVYSRFGDLVDERAVGKCPVMSVADLGRIAAARGLKEPQVFAEGCRAGKRVRLSIDAKGNVVERQSASDRC